MTTPRMLSLHSYRIWKKSKEASARARADIGNDTGDHGHWSFEAVIAIVLAAASVEAFINEVADSIRFSAGSKAVDPPFGSLGNVLDQMEEQHASTELKYLMTGVVVGAPFDPGSNPFQDFATLVWARNFLMHVKDRDQWKEPLDAVWPKKVTALKQRGLVKGASAISPHTKWETMTSYEAIQTPEMAEWAFSTAFAMVDSTLKRCGASSETPLDSLRLLWQHEASEK